MRMPKLATGTWVLGATSDRYTWGGGYSDPVPLFKQLETAAGIPGIKGVEVHQSDFNTNDPDEYAKRTRDLGLQTSNMNTNVWSEKRFKHGAFTNRDRRIRKQALDEARRAVDLARKVGCPSAALWLGSDGFDYPFQTDYPAHWDLLVDAIAQTADYAAPDLRVGIEYKPREPRNRITISDVGKALLICEEIGASNLGVAIDFGHSLMAREAPGESVVLAARKNRLFNVHFNDCLRDWDDDMIPGTVHLAETVEFLFWCKKVGYDGWFGLDMFPYREVGAEAARMAAQNIRTMWKLADSLPQQALARAQATMDAIATQKIVRRIFKAS